MEFAPKNVVYGLLDLCDKHVIPQDCHFSEVILRGMTDGFLLGTVAGAVMFQEKVIIGLPLTICGLGGRYYLKQLHQRLNN